MIEKNSNQHIIPKLEVVDLNFSYSNEEQILSDFSLLVNDKQIVSVVGVIVPPSTCGNTVIVTTLLNSVHEVRVDNVLLALLLKTVV